MKPKSAKYLARARAFVEAVDLAVAIRSAPPWEDQGYGGALPLVQGKSVAAL